MAETVDIIFVERGVGHKSPKRNGVTASQCAVEIDPDSRRYAAAAFYPFLHII